MPVNHLWGMRSTNGINNQFGESVEIFGKPAIRDSRIIYGTITGYGIIDNSIISGNVNISGSPIIKNTVIMGNAIISDTCTLTSSCVADTAVVTDMATVEMSDIFGNCKVSEKAYLRSVRLTDHVIIKGDARVVGVEGGILHIGGYVFIDRGTWRRAPLHFVSSCGLVVTESIDNLININCITNDVRKILGPGGRRYGRIMGMTPEEIDEVQGYAEIIAKETGKCY
jgi:NDP-sugar pyrophosphorylase family protein